MRHRTKPFPVAPLRRVRRPYCDGPLPSEPCVRLVTAHGSSSALPRTTVSSRWHERFPSRPCRLRSPEKLRRPTCPDRFTAFTGSWGAPPGPRQHPFRFGRCRIQPVSPYHAPNVPMRAVGGSRCLSARVSGTTLTPLAFASWAVLFPLELGPPLQAAYCRECPGSPHRGFHVPHR